MAVDRDKRQIIDFYVGCRGLKSWSEFYKTKLADIKTEMYYSDHWPAYKHHLPKEKHLQSKAQTYTIEGMNSNVRHYLKRLTRKTKCYSKSLESLKCAMTLLINKHLINLLFV